MKCYLVFGVELEFLLEREADEEDVPPGTIPSVMASCLTEVETRGLSEVGICRSLCREHSFFDVDAPQIALQGLLLKSMRFVMRSTGVKALLLRARMSMRSAT